jgi:hypothetical protein
VLADVLVRNDKLLLLKGMPPGAWIDASVVAGGCGSGTAPSSRVLLKLVLLGLYTKLLLLKLLAAWIIHDVVVANAGGHACRKRIVAGVARVIHGATTEAADVGTAGVHAADRVRLRVDADFAGVMSRVIC